LRALILLFVPDPKSGDLDALAQCLSILQEATVLSFADADLSKTVARAQTAGTNTRLITAADRISPSLPAFGDEVAAWLDLLRGGGDFDSEAWWFSKISEMNFSDSVWFDLLRLSIVADVVKDEQPEQLFWISDSKTDRVLRSICRSQGIAGKRIGLNSWTGPRFTFVKALSEWGLNALGDLIVCLFLARENDIVQRPKALILAGYPNNWILDKNPVRYRFSGTLPSDGRMGYLVGVTRRSLPRMRNPFVAIRSARILAKTSALAPIFIVERYGSIVDLIWEYARAPFIGLRWWNGWLKRRHLAMWHGIDVWPLLIPHLVRAPLADWPKNRYWRHCIASACKGLSTESVLIPLFELVEGRSAVAGVHQAGARAVGMQHGPNGVAHRWRFDKPLAQVRREAPDLAPDIIAVEGEVVANNLIDSGLDPAIVHIVGAPRITLRTPIFDCRSSTRCILVLGEMHDPNLTFRIAEDLGRRLLGWRIVLRPHPATRMLVGDYIERIIASAPDVFFLSQGQQTFEEELEALQPRALLVGVSGACVAAAKAGWPVVIAKSNWIPNFNPLLQHEEERLLTLTVGNHEELEKFIEIIDGDSLEIYSSICTRAGGEVIAAESEDAVIRMAKVIGL
jgi:hypothetical protein